MYATHPLMVIDPYAKYGMSVSKQTVAHEDFTKTYKVDLEVKGKC